MKQKDFFDLAEELERECGDWENSEGMSKEALEALFSKVEQMDREASERVRLPKKVLWRKKRYLAAVAAAMVLLMGIGAAGSRAWIADSQDLERESEVTTKVNNEEKDSILLEEEAIYQEIGEKLGIAPMRLGFLPAGTELDSYVIMENTGWASVFYLYHDKVISVKMAKDDIEVSSNVQWDGISYELENISNVHGYEDMIEAYCIDEKSQNYGANITYGNGYYNIFGTFDNEKEFLQILNGIYFKNL